MKKFFLLIILIIGAHSFSVNKNQITIDQNLYLSVNITHTKKEYIVNSKKYLNNI